MSDTVREKSSNPDAIVADIVRRLSHRRDSVRKEAECQLAALGPEYTEALLPEAAENAGWRTQGRWWQPSIFLFIAILASSFAFTTYLPLPLHRMATWWWFVGISLARSMAVMIPVVIFSFRPIYRRLFRSVRMERLAPALSRIDDPRVLPSLVAAWPLTAGLVQEAVEANMERQAAAISGEQWDSMTVDDRENLAALLASDSFASANPVVVTSLLSALARHGVRRDLGSVGRLLRKTTDPAVRRAAVDCVAAIEARLQGRTDSSVLLRPTGARADTDSLLHPASGQTADHQVLLQPAGGGTEAREQSIAVIPADH